MKRILIFTGFTTVFFLFSACSEKSKQMQKVDFKGVSFYLQGNWDVVTTENPIDSSFYIGCEKNADAADAFIVRFTIRKIEPELFLENFLLKINSQTTISTEEIKAGHFKEYECAYADYSFSMPISAYYGTAYAFRVHDKTILVVKQSASKRRLNKGFDNVEASFYVK